MPERTSLLAVGLAVGLSLGACSEDPVAGGGTRPSEEPSTEQPTKKDASLDDPEEETPTKPSTPATNTGGKDASIKPSADAGKVVAADAGSGSSTPVDPGPSFDGGTAEADAGAAPSADAGGSTADAAADAAADATVVDAGPTKPGLTTKCTTGSTEACGIFVTSTGTEIELGPYGAVMDKNVGKGFENRVNLLDTDSQCESFALQGFGGSAEEAKAVSDSTGIDLKLYTVYRPATWTENETYPIVTWGNGTCAKPEGYGALLRYVASHGYIVVAANSRWVGSGAAQKQGIDFLVDANDDAESPYYKRVDISKVGAMGHSQGAQGTIAAASDARIDTVIIFNGGVTAVKPFLAISGDRDVSADLNTTNLKNAVDKAPKGAWLFYHKIPERGKADGHLTLMTQPERVTGPTVAWLSYLLSNDAESKEWLVGPNCKLCTQPEEFEYGQKGL